jgi:hypothetical protein
LTNKKVLFLKKIEVYHVPWIALISAKRWRLDVLTFLINGFAQNNVQKDRKIIYSTWQYFH